MRSAPSGSRVTIMPSPYSSESTQSDARALADALGVERIELPIAEVMQAYERDLAEPFAGRAPDITEENLQARIRGNLLMALSNKFGWLVLATGNKSEMSVGYTTLYGDLAGGFAVIKDVPKTLVYRLCEWRNSPAGAQARSGGPPRATAPIPATIISRAPSAELRPDQRDEDSLPVYGVLDRILEGYVELDQSREQLIAQGLPGERRRPRDPARGPRRVQAPPGAARDQDLDARVRARPPDADHERLPRVRQRARPSRPQRAAASRRVQSPAPGWRPSRRSPPGAALAGCGDTIQAKPIPHNQLEQLVVASFPVYWAGGSFQGLQITEVNPDPGGAFTVQYGNCLQGGQGTCTPPLRVVTNPDNSFLPGGQAPARRAVIRGVPAQSTEAGRVITIPTGGVVVGIFARDPSPRARGGAADRRDQPARQSRRSAAGAAARHRLRIDPAAVSAPVDRTAARLSERARAPAHRARPARRAAVDAWGTARTAIVMRVIAQT